MSRGKRLFEAFLVGLVVGAVSSGLYGLGLWLFS